VTERFCQRMVISKIVDKKLTIILVICKWLKNNVKNTIPVHQTMILH